MIEVSDEAAAVLNRSFNIQVRVSSYLDGDLLHDDIPVIATSISEEVDTSLRVPERLTFQVPRFHGGIDWAPVEDNHPLAANGQRLKVELGIQLAFGQVEWFQRGWFVVYESDPQAQTVEVSAEGLLTLIDEARFTGAFQPTGNLSNTIRSLVEPNISVAIDAALTDRAVPSGINYTDDRLDALRAVADAWPATFRVSEDGVLLLEKLVTAPESVLALTNGVGGTVVTALGSSSRENAYNMVQATGTDTNGNVVNGYAYDATGPKRFGGPFNAMPVPFFYSSPLLTTVTQANAAAATRLMNLKRQTTKAFQVTMVPNPTLQAGDVISLTNEFYSNLQCSIEKLSLPYIPVDGAFQQLLVRSLT